MARRRRGGGSRGGHRVHVHVHIGHRGTTARRGRRRRGGRRRSRRLA